jgi:hypothetical protein
MKTHSKSIGKTVCGLATLLAFVGGPGAIAAGTTTTVTTLPSVSVIASDGTALEGVSSGAFTLLRYGPTNNAVTVSIGFSGTASNGVDYGPISSTVTIPAGNLAVDIPVVPLIDTARRGNKTVELTVRTNATYKNVSYRKARVEIIDDIYNIPPPSVSITSPSNGGTYFSPGPISLTVEAGDPDVPITSVSYYANDVFLGKATNSPFSLSWTSVTNGNYAVFARAVDSVNQSVISAPVHITVTNQPVIILGN